MVLLVNILLCMAKPAITTVVCLSIPGNWTDMCLTGGKNEVGVMV